MLVVLLVLAALSVLAVLLVLAVLAEFSAGSAVQEIKPALKEIGAKPCIDSISRTVSCRRESWMRAAANALVSRINEESRVKVCE